MKKYPIRKAYANMVTFEVYEGNLTRKAWKKIKERDGKPSEWKRILMNYFRAERKERGEG